MSKLDSMSRRQFLGAFGAATVAMAGLGLVGCGGNSAASDAAASVSGTVNCSGATSFQTLVESAAHKFEDKYPDVTIAITGGDLGATLDGQSIDTYRAVPVNAGQTLRFTMLRTGCRAFVAFAGGLDIPVVMGSRSTDMKAKIGGYQGRKLQKDDVIAFRAPKTDLKNLGVRHISPEFVPRAEYKLRVVLGPQDDAFTELGIMTFLSSVYTLTPEFDRMGCRLDGEPIEHIKDGNIISDGIAFGAIQVPSAGKPIIMLADRQTTGGYTKIANVISADFRILAQLKMGDRVRFEKVSITDAQEALLAQRATLRCLCSAMNR